VKVTLNANNPVYHDYCEHKKSLKIPKG